MWLEKPNQHKQTSDKAQSLVQYHVYDIIDSDMVESTFDNRSQKVAQVVNSLNSECISLVETTVVESKEELDGNLYGAYLEDGFEGQMSGLPEYDYEQQEIKVTSYRKEFLTDEFEVVSVEEGQGNWSAHVKRFIHTIEMEKHLEQVFEELRHNLKHYTKRKEPQTGRH